MNIDFIRKTTRRWLDKDRWSYVNADNVRFTGADPLYQYMGDIFPDDGSFPEWEWCKLIFSNGKNRGIAYFGLLIEGLRDEDQPYVERLLRGSEMSSWLRDLCDDDSGFRMVEGWDPYRRREEDTTPDGGPLQFHTDPVAAVRSGRG